jgi:hypothetical protein
MKIRVLKIFLFLSLLLVFSSQLTPAWGQSQAELVLRPELVSSKRPVEGPWPKYFPSGYRFQGISFYRIQRGRVVHLRFVKEKKLLSIFSKPRGKNRFRRKVNRRGNYTIIQWQKGDNEFVLVGREPVTVLLKIADSIE